MEHRYSKRMPVHISSWIHARAMDDFPARIKNIGYDGALIESESVVFPMGATVELEFMLNADGRKNRFRLPAMVIHCSADGMGLMFRRHDLRSSPAIRELIRKQRNQYERQTAISA